MSFPLLEIAEEIIEARRDAPGKWGSSAIPDELLDVLEEAVTAARRSIAAAEDACMVAQS